MGWEVEVEWGVDIQTIDTELALGKDSTQSIEMSSKLIDQVNIRKGFVRDTFKL